MTPNGRVLRTIEAGVARPLGASFSGNSRPNADAHIESLYRACCYLVPFGRSGNRGSKHSALRGLVYVVVAAAVFVGLIIVAAIAMAPYSSL